MGSEGGIERQGALCAHRRSGATVHGGRGHQADAAVDIESGERREVYKPRDQLGWPAASPSGRHLAVVDAVCSDRGVVAGDLIVIDVLSGKSESVDTHGVDITYTEWRSDSVLLLAGHRGFETVVGLYDVERRAFSEKWANREVTVGGFYARVSGVSDRGDCVLVGHPAEGRGIRAFPAMIDYAARVVGWFTTHMSG